ADKDDHRDGKDKDKDAIHEHGDKDGDRDNDNDKRDHFKTPTPSATVIATPQANQAMINLGSAANYVVLAYSAITNSGPTNLCGSLGLFPGTSVTGAPVVSCGGVSDVANAAANTAKLDLGIAYTDAAGRTGGAVIPAGSDIGGQTFYPGLYTDLGALSVSSGNLTLDAQGNSSAVFIFQVNGVLSATTNRQVILTGGAKAANIFWQVTGNCALGTGVSFKGNIMAFTAVTFGTGAVLEGRALALNANVTMLSNTITHP
ncbi:MAG TPA: ice-binding family protein, partial [bacterium]